MNHRLTLCGSLGLGAGLMYYLDPDQGRRRRSRVRDRFVHFLKQTDDFLTVIARDLGNRSYGLLAEGRSRFARDGVSDRVLEARVRSKLGRVVAHPRALEVAVHDGRVRLRGPILAAEVNNLLDCVCRLAGVTGIDNQLEVHDQPGKLPDLQGGRTRTGEISAWRQANWAPATRLLAGVAGAGLVAYGMTRRFPTACMIGTVGLGLLARGLTNRRLIDLVGFGASPRLIEVQKTITVAAPIEHVFAFWSRYENFSRFMAHVRDVRPEVGTPRSHWVVAGPAGIPIEWDTAITRFEPNQVIAWETVPGSPVAHAGTVRFEAQPAGHTRITVRLCYKPPAGALGHAVATLFGADPKQALDDDLMRFKSLIELGKTSAHGEHIHRKDLIGAAEEQVLHSAPVGR